MSNEAEKAEITVLANLRNLNCALTSCYFRSGGLP